MTEKISSLVIFFHAVMNELRRKLTPAELTGLLKEYKTGQEEKDVEASRTPTPGQTPDSADGRGDCRDTT